VALRGEIRPLSWGRGDFDRIIRVDKIGVDVETADVDPDPEPEDERVRSRVVAVTTRRAFPHFFRASKLALRLPEISWSVALSDVIHFSWN